MNLTEIRNSLKTVYQVKVSVYAIGGEGIVKLKELTTNKNLSDVRRILEAYIATLTEAESTPVEFLTSSWQNFGVDVTPPVMPFRRVALSELYFAFRHAQSRLEALGERLRVLTARPQSSPQTTQEIQVVQQQYAALAGRVRRIQAQGLNCLREPEDLCNLDMNYEPLPPVPEAVYENTWVGRDQFGNRFFFDFFYENSALVDPNVDFHAVLTSGLQADPLSVRITEVELIGPFPPNTEEKVTERESTGRSFRMVRRPNASVQQETRRLYYEVLRRTCVRFCFGEP
ncbi:MAG: hypothetical protein R2712_09265 [Vicinamibacterales bacterium]